MGHRVFIWWTCLFQLQWLSLLGISTIVITSIQLWFVWWYLLAALTIDLCLILNLFTDDFQKTAIFDRQHHIVLVLLVWNLCFDCLDNTCCSSSYFRAHVTRLRWPVMLLMAWYRGFFLLTLRLNGCCWSKFLWLSQKSGIVAYLFISSFRRFVFVVWRHKSRFFAGAPPS